MEKHTDLPISENEENSSGQMEHSGDMHNIIYVHSMFENYFLDYASQVILNRAIPEIADGLKPVQRRILHSMFELEDGRYNKVANIVGNTMKYHPHGDSSIGDAIVQLGQKSLTIDTQGNWGNIYTGDSAAAVRYIEARLTKFALEVIFNPKTTDWQLSYDRRNKEPITLPVKFPLLLAQGAKGIAVSLQTEILPHNFIELIDASIAILQNRDFTIYPDFQTGGTIDVSKYNDGARGGRVKCRAKISILDNKTLVINDIPYATTTTDLIASITKRIEEGKLKIKKIDDNTAANVEILLHLHQGVSPDQTIDALYAFTDCEKSYATNACVIHNRKPIFSDVKTILRINTENSVMLLKRELEIQLEELENQWHRTSLEKLFFEKRIYKELEKEYLDYCERIDYLHIEEEFKRIVMKMCLEDTVYAWWTEGGNQASLYYLNPFWCQLGDKVNGVWTYKIRVNAVPDYCLDNMPKDLARLIRRGKISINPDVDIDTYFVVPPIQKSFCVKYNDHIMYSYPPFVSIIRAIMRLQKIRDISDSQDEIDALNLIAFEIPVAEDDKLQDHLLLSGPTVAKFTQSANDIVNGLVGILPTPMKATALNLGSNRNIDKSRPITILDEYGDEVSIPKMGGSNVSAAVLNRQIQFTHGKLFGMYKSIANSINLKMYLDGYIYRNYEFSFKLLEMSEFNKTEVRSDLLKQIQVGVATKMQSMAAFGQNPREMIGTSYMENIVLADVPLNSLVYQTAYTQSGNSSGGTQGNGVKEGLVNSSGRPEKPFDELSPSTIASKESRENTGSTEANTV